MRRAVAIALLSASALGSGAFVAAGPSAAAVPVGVVCAYSDKNYSGARQQCFISDKLNTYVNINNLSPYNLQDNISSWMLFSDDKRVKSCAVEFYRDTNLDGPRAERNTSTPKYDHVVYTGDTDNKNNKFSDGSALNDRTSSFRFACFTAV